MQEEAKVSGEVMEWLLEPNQPVMRFRTLTELLGRRDKDPEVVEAKNNIPTKGWAREILASQKEQGYWENADSLYVPKYIATNWKAIVLSDFGLTREEPRIKKAAELFLTQWLDPDKENIYHEDVCIVGNTARMLTRFGYGDDPRVAKLFDRLVEDQKSDGGWHCFESNSGTLDCWEALAAYSVLPRTKRTRKINSSIERGAEFYLERRLYDDGQPKYEPWFRFHYPIHYYYDLLVGLDVVTRLGYASDPRLSTALEIMRKKRSSDGKWRMEKIHPDIGEGADYSLRNPPIPFVIEDEGEPSKWLTLAALLVEMRVSS